MEFLVEGLGYLGMALVLISMMRTKVEMLRYFNLCGSVISMIYGFCTGTMPTALLNLGLTVINIIQIARLWKQKKA